MGQDPSQLPSVNIQLKPSKTVNSRNLPKKGSVFGDFNYNYCQKAYSISPFFIGFKFQKFQLSQNGPATSSCLLLAFNICLTLDLPSRNLPKIELYSPKVDHSFKKKNTRRPKINMKQKSPEASLLTSLYSPKIPSLPRYPTLVPQFPYPKKLNLLGFFVFLGKPVPQKSLRSVNPLKG